MPHPLFLGGGAAKSGDWSSSASSAHDVDMLLRASKPLGGHTRAEMKRGVFFSFFFVLPHEPTTAAIFWRHAFAAVCILAITRSIIRCNARMHYSRRVPRCHRALEPLRGFIALGRHRELSAPRRPRHSAGLCPAFRRIAWNETGKIEVAEGFTIYLAAGACRASHGRQHGSPASVTRARPVDRGQQGQYISDLPALAIFVGECVRACVRRCSFIAW